VELKKKAAVIETRRVEAAAGEREAHARRPASRCRRRAPDVGGAAVVIAGIAGPP
jgi:hypothetical protein